MCSLIFFLLKQYTSQDLFQFFLNVHLYMKKNLLMYTLVGKYFLTVTSTQHALLQTLQKFYYYNLSHPSCTLHILIQKISYLPVTYLLKTLHIILDVEAHIHANVKIMLNCHEVVCLDIIDITISISILVRSLFLSLSL